MSNQLKKILNFDEDILKSNFSHLEVKIIKFLIQHPEYVDDLQKVDKDTVDRGVSNG